MTTTWQFGAEITVQDGVFIARFPDLPEAITEGASEAEALIQAQDCLDAALFFRMKDGAVIPLPKARSGILIAPSADIALRVALYRAVQEQSLSPQQMQARYGLSPAAFGALFGTRRAADTGRAAALLRKMGKRIVVSVDAA